MKIWLISFHCVSEILSAINKTGFFSIHKCDYKQILLVKIINWYYFTIIKSFNFQRNEYCYVGFLKINKIINFGAYGCFCFCIISFLYSWTFRRNFLIFIFCFRIYTEDNKHKAGNAFFPACSRPSWPLVGSHHASYFILSFYFIFFKLGTFICHVNFIFFYC